MSDTSLIGREAEPQDVKTMLETLIGDIYEEPDPLWRYLALTSQQTLLDAVVSAIKVRRGAEMRVMADTGMSYEQIARATGLGSKQRVSQLIAPPAVVVELYRGEAPDSIGTLLEDWDGTLDADTWEWLTDQGYDTEDPDLWVNIVPVGTWAPNNHPIAERTIRIGGPNHPTQPKDNTMWTLEFRATTISEANDLARQASPTAPLSASQSGRLGYEVTGSEAACRELEALLSARGETSYLERARRA